jgi:hypothetical protein
MPPFFDCQPKPSPLVLLFGSFDRFVEEQVLPGVEAGALDGRDTVDVIAALRDWETDGTWERPYAR